MLSIIKQFNNVVLFLLFITIFSNPLYCYIDPGTGSYALQIIIAVLVGIIFAFKLFWNKVKTFISAIFPKKEKK